MDKLTIKQEKFAQGLFTGLSQREAYKQAYDAKNMTDKSIDEKACELANCVKVTERINELTNELKNKNMLTVQKVVDELSGIAFDDVKNYLSFKMDERTKQVSVAIKDSETIDTKNISEVSVGKDGQFKFKLYCKDNALVQLGKHLGMFTENVNIKADVNSKVELIDEAYDRKIMAEATPEELAVLGEADKVYKAIMDRIAKAK